MPTKTHTRKPLDPNKLRQRDVGSIEELLRQANDCVSWFNQRIALFASDTNGTVYKHGSSMKCDKGSQSLKPSARAYQKANQKGDYRYIKDMIRATVYYKDCASVAAALEKLYNNCAKSLETCRYFKIVEVKSSVDVPKPASYADINLIFICPKNRHLCELQIHFEKMLAAKDGTRVYGKTKSGKDIVGKYGKRLKEMGKHSAMRKSGHDHYNVQRAACKGQHINKVRAQQGHMQPATNFGGGWVQNKTYAQAYRALKDGQATYSLAHAQIRQDPGKKEMTRKLRLLTNVAKQNARKYMEWLAKDDQKQAAMH